MADRLPLGIHFRSGESPPEFFRLVTFNFKSTATRSTAVLALTEICALLNSLRDGFVPDLAPLRPDDPFVKVNSGDLNYVLCFGRRLFDPTNRSEPLVPVTAKPDGLPPLRPLPNGPFPALHWARSAQHETGQTDFAIQFTAKSELASGRPIVEIRKLIQDRDLPIDIVTFFSGFHRDDRRSWIDFHDGINNMPSEQRLEAIEVRQDPQNWLVGGSTMVFLKIAIDLEGWRQLSRSQQEAIVGRDKLSGCPIDNLFIDQDGRIELSRMGCPFNSEIGEGEGWNDEFRDPPPLFNTANSSHIHRANLTRQSPSQAAARRLYRQGYEFIDAPASGGIEIGLNFVSYQRDARLLTSILSSGGWMGDANFGGIPGNQSVPAFSLMKVLAGGFFAVPPLDDPFPGHVLFR
jgi:Dyp-type peroxidase family